MQIRKYILLLIIFLPLLLFRDFTPNNELKYLSIADEAIRSGHFFTLTNHNINYADKPPLYFWGIMLGKSLLGTHSMFFAALLSLIPAFVILYTMDKWCRSTMDKGLRQTSQLMLATTGLFIGSAIVLRMDMLMCMFIILALYTFYKIYRNTHRKKDTILLPLYIFLALFSKGPVGLLIPLLSILAFLIVKKEYKSFNKYFGIKQWSVLIGLSLLWFLCVYFEGGKAYLNDLLFNQTVNRAIKANEHREPIYYYIISVWYSLAPWALLYIPVILIGIKKKLIRTDIRKFFLTVIAVTLVTLSMFSSKLDIYLLPVFPFFTYLSVLILPDIKGKYIYLSIIIPAVIFAASLPALFLIQKHINFNIQPYILYPAVTILTLSGVMALVSLYRQKLTTGINSLACGILLTIFIGSFAIPALNPYIGHKELSRQALQIARENNISDFYFYRFRSGENIDVYLNKNIKKIESDSITPLSQKENFILFIKNKDKNKDINIEKAIEGKPIHTVANYSLVVFNKTGDK